MAVRQTSKFFNIQNGQSRIGNGFSHHAFGVGAESFCQIFFCIIRIYKRAFNPHLLHGHAVQIKSTAIYGTGADEMISGFADIQHSIKVSRLTGRSQHSTYAAFQRCNFRRHCVTGGIL